VPVFVLTHHAREPLALQGGTTFTFVTDGAEAALERARAAAGDRDVSVAGGANVAQQYLRTGLLDEVRIHLRPIFSEAECASSSASSPGRWSSSRPASSNPAT
jgi:dihydrofolate reductase